MRDLYFKKWFFHWDFPFLKHNLLTFYVYNGTGRTGDAADEERLNKLAAFQKKALEHAFSCKRACLHCNSHLWWGFFFFFSFWCCLGWGGGYSTLVSLLCAILLASLMRHYSYSPIGSSSSEEDRLQHLLHPPDWKWGCNKLRFTSCHVPWFPSPSSTPSVAAPWSSVFWRRQVFLFINC